MVGSRGRAWDRRESAALQACNRAAANPLTSPGTAGFSLDQRPRNPPLRPVVAIVSCRAARSEQGPLIGSNARPSIRQTITVRPAAGFHRHQAPRLGRKELHQFPSGDFLPEHSAPRSIRSVRLKCLLRDVQADCANLRHGRLPQVVFSTPPLWHNRCRRGASTLRAERHSIQGCAFPVHTRMNRITQSQRT
jgi:hypothetical protein